MSEISKRHQFALDLNEFALNPTMQNKEFCSLVRQIQEAYAKFLSTLTTDLSNVRAMKEKQDIRIPVLPGDTIFIGLRPGTTIIDKVVVADPKSANLAIYPSDRYIQCHVGNDSEFFPEFFKAICDSSVWEGIYSTPDGLAFIYRNGRRLFLMNQEQKTIRYMDAAFSIQHDRKCDPFLEAHL